MGDVGSVGEVGEEGSDHSLHGCNRVVREEVKTNEVLVFEVLLEVTKEAEEILGLQSLRLMGGGGGDFRRGLVVLLEGEG